MPEVIPLGLFTWSIESIPNRVPRKQHGQRQDDNHDDSHGLGKFSGSSSARSGQQKQGMMMDKHQVAAEHSFQKQKAYFSDPKRVPYPLQGDAMRMGNRMDQTKKAEKERLKGYGEELRRQKAEEGVSAPAAQGESPDGFGQGSTSSSSSGSKRRADANTPGFYRCVTFA